MKRPVNFEKLDYNKFQILGTELYLKVDNVQEDWIWIMTEGETDWTYVILLKFDFQHNKYNTRLCFNGLGMGGRDLNYGSKITTEMFKTKETFVDNVKIIIMKIANETDLTDIKDNNNSTIGKSNIAHKVLSSDGSKEYEVIQYNDGTGVWTCNCPAFQYSKEVVPTCKHIKQIRK